MARHAEVQFGYVSQKKQEMSINLGDVVEIIDDSSSLEGWVLVRLNDKQGYVPMQNLKLLGQYGRKELKSSPLNERSQ